MNAQISPLDDTPAVVQAYADSTIHLLVCLSRVLSGNIENG
jgi:hypothetical protein